MCLEQDMLNIMVHPRCAYVYDSTNMTRLELLSLCLVGCTIELTYSSLLPWDKKGRGREM